MITDQDNVLVFPNPVISTTTIENAANSTVTISDMSSRVVFSQSISSDSEIIDLSTLAVGVYFVEVKGIGTLEVIKIVKK